MCHQIPPGRFPQSYVEKPGKQEKVSRHSAGKFHDVVFKGKFQ
jgi:hypothetical protein